MSTSAIDRKCVKLALYDLLFAAVTALGGFVYEQFSHGVYSGFMAYAFLSPLVLGTCPLLILALCGKALPGRWCVRLYHWGIIVLTVGCLFQWGAGDLRHDESPRNGVLDCGRCVPCRKPCDGREKMSRIPL